GSDGVPAGTRPGLTSNRDACHEGHERNGREVTTPASHEHAGHTMPMGEPPQHMAPPVPTENHSDHSGHNMSDPAMGKAMELDVRRRFWVAFVLTVPIAVLAGHAPGVPMPGKPPLSS